MHAIRFHLRAPDGLARLPRGTDHPTPETVREGLERSLAEAPEQGAANDPERGPEHRPERGAASGPERGPEGDGQSGPPAPVRIGHARILTGPGTVDAMVFTLADRPSAAEAALAAACAGLTDPAGPLPGWRLTHCALDTPLAPGPLGPLEPLGAPGHPGPTWH
ncbi:hypothetical protein ACFZDG_20235 [Kitasatospora xanthocidica]|uniref:hypothetical protein n=1 Tax=Kitasatospora xanthocidica TaxID=83382 RepID=UPI0036ED6407